MRNLLVIGLVYVLSACQPYQPQPLAQPQPSATVTFQNQTYELYIAKVTDLTRISLISNLPAKASSSVLKSVNQCHTLVNGGFYSKDDQHLGWFVSNSQQLNPIRTSQLFNGFFWIDSDQAFIATSPPPNTPRLGLQSGPLLILNSQPVELSAGNNNSEPRSIAAISTAGEIHFIRITGVNSTSGPTLSNLASILIEWASAANLNLESAINLDGGSHSALLTDSVSLTELNPIGSFFCIQ